MFSRALAAGIFLSVSSFLTSPLAVAALNTRLESQGSSDIVPVYSERDIQLEIVIVEGQDLDAPLENYSSDAIFGEGGIADQFGYLLDVADKSGGKKTSACYKGGKCVLQKSEKSGVGIASWYGPGFQGKKTACGDRFDTKQLTAAHKTLPFGTLVRVTYKGKSTVVRINDRGPFVKGRVIDLSQAAKNVLDLPGIGPVKLAIERCGG